MQVIFEEIRYKNLLSAGNEWIVISFVKHSMTLCVGVNGGGKSTMIDALTYNLFNRAFRNINLTNLINSVNNKDCVTEVKFKAGSNRYKIVRGMKPNIFEIWENGVKIDQDASAKDYQRILERILGFNFKSFSQVIVMGSTSYVPFMKLKPQDRRAVIENLLDIEVFGIMGAIAKIDNKALEIDMYANERHTAITSEKIDIQKKNMELARKENHEIILAKAKEMASVEEEIKGQNFVIKVKQEDIDKLKATIMDEKKVDTKLDKLQDIKRKLSDEYNRIEKEIEFFNSHDSCPRCKQFMVNAAEVIEELTKKKAEFGVGLGEARKKIAEVQKRAQEIWDVKSDIAKMESGMRVEQQTLDRMKYNKEHLSWEIKQLNNKPKFSNEMIQMSEGLIADLEKLKAERKEQQTKKDYFDVIEMLLKDSGIKAKIIGQYIPVINKYINKYLSDMDFFVDFHIDEEFNETIKSRHRDTYSYENFSEGQKRRIDLALLFTWREVARLKNSVHTNLLIMDEVLDGSLDSQGIEEFMTLMKVFAKNNNTFLISHRGDVIMDKFPNIMEFKKTGLFTEMNEVTL